ncbi:hypothetical protein F5884DRAFT_460352 [Xylogone sp. PMI_703]|nr:hypothetical protein F5884DRAFT_460352 [Xylogone sp. PMI_703]
MREREKRAEVALKPFGWVVRWLLRQWIFLIWKFRRFLSRANLLVCRSTAAVQLCKVAAWPKSKDTVETRGELGTDLLYRLNLVAMSGWLLCFSHCPPRKASPPPMPCLAKPHSIQSSERRVHGKVKIAANKSVSGQVERGPSAITITLLLGWPSTTPCPLGPAQSAPCRQRISRCWFVLKPPSRGGKVGTLALR